jgi:hypothetical protein
MYQRCQLSGADKDRGRSSSRTTLTATNTTTLGNLPTTTMSNSNSTTMVMEEEHKLQQQSSSAAITTKLWEVVVDPAQRFLHELFNKHMTLITHTTINQCLSVYRQ